MSIAATIPVRLSDDILDRLDDYAHKIGISRSAAIRLCLAYQLGIILSANPMELRGLDARYTRPPEAPSEEIRAAKFTPAPSRLQAAEKSATTPARTKVLPASRQTRAKRIRVDSKDSD